MDKFLIVGSAGLFLIALSLIADGRFRSSASLPMQWSLSGDVNWSAARPIALSVTPVLGISILAATAAGMALFEPKPGDEGLDMPVLALMALVFSATHLLHLWLIDRTLRRAN